MPRFFVPASVCTDSAPALTGEQAGHCKVLRLHVGDSVTLCDGAGLDYPGEITAISPTCVELALGAGVPSETEPQVAVSVYMAFSKGDKLEHVIQKATELGAFEIVAFPTSRCVSRPEGKSLGKKVERWQKIALAAAQQCGRGRIPQVRVLDSFSQALTELVALDLGVLLYESEREFSLKQALAAKPATVGLLSGPEGGFAPEEVAMATEKGVAICTLGKRILRCETAPLCALTATMFALGELD